MTGFPVSSYMRFLASRRAAWFVGLVVFFPAAASAQTSDNVLLVINDTSPASVQVGEYYARKRAIADDHIVHINTVATDTVDRAEYLRAIESPIADSLAKHSLQDKVLYVVLTKGVPLRVAGTEGLQGTIASVDSELTLLYRKLTGIPSPVAGRVQNSYFLGDKPLAEAKPFTRFLADTYLVTRLDGFTVDDTMKLIDRGMTPSRDGKIVLDQKATVVDRGGDDWLRQAADRLRETTSGDQIVLEATRALASTTGPVMGYYSWGSNDPANQLRHLGLEFANGALAGLFVSTDGRTFAEPPADWKPSDPNGRGPRFGGGFQSLAGDLIREGVTGVSAHVAEPYLDATIRPQILFPAYLAGFNLAESFYLAMPFLSWQTVIVGDPLCTPFPRDALSTGQLYKAIDPETELPALYAERRLALLSRGGLNVAALKLLLKADVQSALDNQAGAEELLARAAQLEPRLTIASLRLASIYEARGEYDKAIERYRAIIAVEPRNGAALNNLAYALAERQHAPQEALPFAERAFRLSTDPNVADTLGWIQHLLGDDKSAGPLLEQAAAAARDNVEILLHAAFVHGALNDRVKARLELDAAEKLDLRVSERPDVQALRQKLKGSN
jgi:uncharacterized protein (TIGR03790 family)